MKTFALAAATVGLALSGTSAFADEPQIKTATVSTAGLDLSSPEGQRMLDNRIKFAARKVCDVGEAPLGTRITPSAASDCYDKALASAKRQVATLVLDKKRGG